ncbi:MAG TPA: hypothetical protein VGN95_10940 [Pyrinomonadaceae bacterium]|nr:hypothetical protein [Pyrinomonadaceae bacterium]
MLKKKLVPLMLSVSCALLLAACSKSDNTASTNNATTTSKTTTTSSPATATTTTTSSPTTTTTASSGDKIGVPECDDFVAKMEACFPKLPAVAREDYDKNFEKNMKEWRDAASTPQGRAKVAQQCKAITDIMKQSTKGYNCDF